MIDITKEEFWNSDFQEEIIKQESRLKKTIKKHKLMTIALVSLGIFTLANIILIYNFFKILEKL